MKFWNMLLFFGLLVAGFADGQTNGRIFKSRPGRIIRTCAREMEVLRTLQNTSQECDKALKTVIQATSRWAGDPMLEESHSLIANECDRLKERVNEEFIDCEIACRHSCDPDLAESGPSNKLQEICTELSDTVQESFQTRRSLKAVPASFQDRSAINLAETTYREALQNCRDVCPGFDCEQAGPASQGGAEAMPRNSATKDSPIRNNKARNDSQSTHRRTSEDVRK